MKEDAFLAEVSEAARLAKKEMAADEAAAAGDAAQLDVTDDGEAAWYHAVISKATAEGVAENVMHFAIIFLHFLVFGAFPCRGYTLQQAFLKRRSR